MKARIPIVFASGLCCFSFAQFSSCAEGRRQMAKTTLHKRKSPASVPGFFVDSIMDLRGFEPLTS